jgi:hypothetical protein
MAAISLNLNIEQGSDYEITLTINNDDDNSPLNLTGYDAESVLRKHYGASNSVDFDISFVNRLLGQISLSMPREKTSLLKEGRYVYDVVLLSPNDVKTRVIQGSVLVSPGVTL